MLILWIRAFTLIWFLQKVCVAVYTLYLLISYINIIKAFELVFFLNEHCYGFPLLFLFIIAFVTLTFSMAYAFLEFLYRFSSNTKCKQNWLTYLIDWTINWEEKFFFLRNWIVEQRSMSNRPTPSNKICKCQCMRALIEKINEIQI